MLNSISNKTSKVLFLYLFSTAVIQNYNFLTIVDQMRYISLFDNLDNTNAHNTP